MGREDALWTRSGRTLSETRTWKGMWWWVGGYGSLERQYYWAIINLRTGKHVEKGEHLSELLIMMSQSERFPHLLIDTRIAKIWDWSLSCTIQEKTWKYLLGWYLCEALLTRKCGWYRNKAFHTEIWSGFQQGKLALCAQGWSDIRSLWLYLMVWAMEQLWKRVFLLSIVT